MKRRIKKFLHDKLDWGYPLKKVGGDWFQQTYSCQLCKREVTQDSTGAWFHLS